MDNSSIGYIALVALFGIFFIVASIFSGRTWRVLHVLIVMGIFLASGTFFFMAAITLKAHQSWRDEVRHFSERIDEELEKIDIAKVEVIDARQQLSQVLEDRGRAWFGQGTIQAGDQPQAQVELDRPTPSQIAPDMIVYAFEYKDAPGDDEPKRDGLYLGKYKIAGVTDNTITIEAADPLREGQKQRIAGKQGYWVLYEIMPIDNHESFAELGRDELEELLPAADVFADAADHARLIDQYVRDGQDATDEDMQNHPDRVWVELAVHESVEHEVPDGDGGAETVQFHRGTKMIVPQPVADLLTAADVAQEERKVYRRMLRRYENIYRDVYVQELRLDDKIEQKKIQQAIVDESQQICEQRIATRQTEKEGLTADLGRVQGELQNVTDYLDQLQQQHAAVRSRLTAVFNANNRMAAEIAKLQLEADRRIRANVASQ